MKNSLVTTSIFLLLFLNLKTYSQTISEEKLPLISILTTLEERYQVLFSFADETIKGKKCAPIESSLSLNESLEIIASETELDFQILNPQYIVITPKKAINNTDFEPSEFLKEVVIQQYLTKGISKLQDGSLTIRPEYFEILPGLIEPDILQTIQSLPGVLSADERVSNINIRGGTHDQNLFLWDGIKMYQSGHFFGLISAFNPYTTEQINVLKNGTSARFGDGVSSIIDMRLPDEIDGEFKAGLGANLINLDAFAKIPISENSELQISGRRSVTDMLLTPTYENYFNRIFQDSDLKKTDPTTETSTQDETFFFHDFSAKFLSNISEKDKIRIQLFNAENTLNYEEVLNDSNSNSNLKSELSQKNRAAGISYSRNWSSTTSTTAQFYISHYDVDATNYDVVNVQKLVQENEVIDGTAKLDIAIKGKTAHFNTGYQFSEIGVGNLGDVNDPLFKSYVKEVLRTHAVYVESSLFPHLKSTNLILGVRANYFDKFDSYSLEPRFNFHQKFLKNFTFELLGELKSQTTSQIIDLQKDFLGIENRRWVLANNLKEPITIEEVTFYPIPILKSKQISAGFQYNNNGLLLGIESYYKKVDGITSRSQGFQNQFQFENTIGSYSIKGIDFLINKIIRDKFSIWASYTLSENNYLFPELNNNKSFPNNTDIRQAATLAATYAFNRLKLGFGMNWHSGKPTTQPNLNEPILDDEINYEAPNSSNLPNYLRADVSAVYNFNFSSKTKGSLGISIWNVFNAKNTLNEYYTIDSNAIKHITNNSLELTPNLSFRVNF